MLLKGKYKNIILIFTVFFSLIYIIVIHQEYKYITLSKNMNVKDMIGQRLMTAPEGQKLTTDFKNLIRKHHIGNLKIYGYNYKNKKQLNSMIIECQNLSLKYNRGIPMFVAHTCGSKNPAPGRLKVFQGIIEKV